MNNADRLEFLAKSAGYACVLTPDQADACRAGAAAIRALPAPEVPEAVKAWCGHFRTCVAYSDKEDIWPEADFNLLAYFEKEYPDA